MRTADGGEDEMREYASAQQQQAAPRRAKSGLGAGFLVGWVLTHMAAWAVLGLLLFGFEIGPDSLPGIMLAATVAGLVLGLVQWPHLRPHLIAARWWPLASALGALAGTLVGAGVGLLLQSLEWIASAATVVAATAVLGVAQWWLLRRQVARAGWWIAANALGWGVGLVAGFLVVVLGFLLEPTLNLPGGLFTGGALGGAVAGAVGGASSGSVLLWLLRRHSLRDARS
jgi:hypothetical protein